MSKPMTACECGGQEFIVFETIIHDGEVSYANYDDNKLHCHNANAGGIDKIVCSKCNKEYPTPDIEIEFN